MSREFGALSGSDPSRKQPYVGRDAFAHKAGLHAHGMSKTTRAYEHIDPASVGNTRHFPVSDQTGRAGLRMRVEALGVRIDSDDALRHLAVRVKAAEARGLRLEKHPEAFRRLVHSSLRANCPV